MTALTNIEVLKLIVNFSYAYALCNDLNVTFCIVKGFAVLAYCFFFKFYVRLRFYTTNNFKAKYSIWKWYKEIELKLLDIYFFYLVTIFGSTNPYPVAFN